MKKRFHISHIPVYLVIFIFSVVALFPFYVMLIMGTYKNEELFTGLHLLAGNYLGENMKTILATDFLLYYRNSLIVATAATIGSVLISALTGFVFAKFHFKGKNFLFLVVLGSMHGASAGGIDRLCGRNEMVWNRQ